MTRLAIALLAGGISSEREVSLKGGDQVYAALDKDKYAVRRYDPKTDLARLVADAPELDAALIIMHGPFGEDGTVQGMLDLLNVPYQGAGVLGSALAMNKLAAKQMYEKAGLTVPSYTLLRRNDPLDAHTGVHTLGLPLVVKPVSGGSSIGTTIVRTEDRLQEALDAAFAHDHSVLVEDFIDGIELTGGVIGNDELEALPLVEIIPNEGYSFFDYEAKYKTGATREICPARVDDAVAKTARDQAIQAHRALFCRGYSRTDFILKDKDLYVLETNTIPGMTPTSLLPLAARTAGIEFSRLLDRLITLCIEDHRQNPSIRNTD
ncbi:MAG: D-alanine--D-alanine ligase family protein [Thermodesulfobacteriota bacterium]